MTTEGFVTLVKQMIETGDSPMALRNSIQATLALIDVDAFCSFSNVTLDSLSDEALSSLYELSTNSGAVDNSEDFK
jgi:hypothetical protein